MLTQTTPANDTAPLPVGTTYETALWRAHRYSGSIEVTSLANAGKRGKTCLRLSVVQPVGLDALDGVAAWIAAAVWADASEALMAEMLADVSLAGLTFCREEKRGVDVPAEPKIDVRGDLVRATFTTRDALVTFTDIMGRPGATFRQDQRPLTPMKPADAAKGFV